MPVLDIRCQDRCQSCCCQALSGDWEKGRRSFGRVIRFYREPAIGHPSLDGWRWKPDLVLSTMLMNAHRSFVRSFVRSFYCLFYCLFYCPVYPFTPVQQEVVNAQVYNCHPYGKEHNDAVKQFRDGQCQGPLLFPITTRDPL